jgi:hypothetical protein
MDWLLGGPAAPFLGEEDNFDATLAPPPPGIFFGNGMDAWVAFCPTHGYRPCPARDGVLLCPVHGYGPCPLAPATPPQEQEDVDMLDAYPASPTPAAPASPVLTAPASPSAPPAPAASSPPSPSPEARRLLRRFASAMATHRVGLRVDA